MASCMTTENIDRSSKHSNVNTEFKDCENSTVHTQACHAGRCHANTIYTHTCNDAVLDNLCDYLTVDYDVFNTSNWRNTTCNLTACIQDLDETSALIAMEYESCTNNECRNGTSEINISLDFSSTNFNARNIHSDSDDIFNIPCVNLLYSRYKRVRFAQKINKIKHL